MEQAISKRRPTREAVDLEHYESVGETRKRWEPAAVMGGV